MSITLSTEVEAVLNSLIKAGASKVFTRVFIKRRLAVSGLFEDDWLEITRDVMSFGKLKYEIDAARFSEFRLPTLSLKVANDEGRFNDEDDKNSYWFGYASRNRSLVRVEAGFRKDVQGDDGIWQNREYPHNSYWDQSWYDVNDWDATNTIFVGVLTGDITQSDKNIVALKAKPLTEVFREYSARNLTGFDTSMTAAKFVQIVRDHTVGGDYIFRPFFGDTTTNWSFTSTSVIYSQMDTNTADEVRAKNVWSIMTKLAEAENHVPLITRDGQFKFVNRDFNTTASYEFHGEGSNDRVYGRTMKNISKYGFKRSKYYSRVLVKYDEADTNTSYHIVESTMTVDGANNAWNLGERTFRIDNNWIPTATVADDIATQVFNDYSSAKREIEFNTSFIPHVDLLDVVSVTYDTSPINQDSLWDLRDWASSTSNTVNDLIFDDFNGDAIKLSDEEMRVISMEIDLDKYECRWTLRET